MGMGGGGWEERRWGGRGWEERGWAGSLRPLTEDRLPAQVFPCTAGSVVPATRGRCEHAWRGLGAWHAEPKTPGQSHHCRHPAPLLRAWPAPSSREAAL